MKRLITNSVVAVAVLFGGVNLLAKESHTQMIQKSVKKESKKQNKKFDKRSQKLVVALHKTFQALSALQYNKDKEAIKLLKEADKDFSDVLKKEPNLKLIPIENRMEVFAFEGSSKDVKVALESVAKLIKHHKTQIARDIMIPLKDEMDITTVFIPMDTYPKVIKDAIKDLEKNDKKKAVAGLIAGLNTLVGEEVVIPLPLLMAQDVLNQASTMDKTKKDDIQKLISLATDELKKSVYLGYVDEDSKIYKQIRASIDDLEKEIKGENKVEKIYKNIKDEFKSLLDKLRNDKHQVAKTKQNSAQKAVQEYQKEQMQKAIKEL
jgi:hypothetical protein